MRPSVRNPKWTVAVTMKNTNWKDVAELLGIAAIVASLVFVVLELRQSQRIASSETYVSLYSSRIEVANSISEHVDVWMKGTTGDDLTQRESAIFAILVNQLAESGIQTYYQVNEIEGEEAAAISAREFAIFLYHNPGARKVWASREEYLISNHGLLNERGPSFSNWNETVQLYLSELDRIKPTFDTKPFVDW